MGGFPSSELYSRQPTCHKGRYSLKEAQVIENGNRLGPVGGRIVAEVFLGLLQRDPQSYCNVQPNWVPTLPAQGGTGESFRMIDFLKFAGLDPMSRGQ